jgi:hypothetical protein
MTSYKVLKAIKEGDSGEFIKLIGVTNLGVIGKNEEMIEYDVKKYESLFKKYFGDNVPQFDITEQYNSLGQMQVKINLFRENGATYKKESHLSLLFGPPNIVSLDKISGYSLIENNSDSLDFHPLSYWQRKK